MKKIFNILSFMSLALIILTSSGCFGGGTAKGPKLVDTNPKQLLFEYTLTLQSEEFFLNPTSIRSFVKKVEAAAKNTINLNDKSQFHFLEGLSHQVLGEFAIYEGKPEIAENHLKCSITAFENYIQNSTDKNSLLLYLYFSAKTDRLLGRIKNDPESVKQSIFKLKKEYYLIAKQKAEFGVFTLNKSAVMLELADSYITLGLHDLAEEILQSLSSDSAKADPAFMEVLANLRISQRKIDEAILTLQNFNLNSFEDYFRKEFNLYRLAGLYSVQVLKGKSLAGKELNLIKNGTMKQSYYFNKLIKEFHGIYLNGSEHEVYVKNLWDTYNGTSDNTNYTLDDEKKDTPMILHLKDYLRRLKKDDLAWKKNYSIDLKSSESQMIWNQVCYQKDRLDLSIWFYLNDISKEYAVRFTDSTKVLSTLTSDNLAVASAYMKLNYSKLKEYIQSGSIRLSLFDSRDNKTLTTFEIPVKKSDFSAE